MRNFISYIKEADEKKENKNVQLILSENLKKIFKEINSPISKKILELSNSDMTFDISFLDCDIKNKEKIDKISFLPAGKVIFGMLSNNHVNLEDNFNAKGRQEMSIGRIVNKLIPNTFTPQDVEKFVEYFTASVAKYHSKFRLVEGEEIRKFYLFENYEDNKKGDINSSCMRYKEAQRYLDIYCNNPEKVKLLILMSDINKDKIKGRALVWEGLRKPTGVNFMDRIYTLMESDKQLFIAEAIKNNWIYKAAQTMHDSTYIENGKKVYGSIAIQLKPEKYKQYPYMDTLSYYTPSTGRLGSNDGNYIPGHPRIRLDSAVGGYSTIDR